MMLCLDDLEAILSCDERNGLERGEQAPAM